MGDAPVPKRYERYVAIGDSSTEGIDDPDGTGHYRGWSRRLAGRIARVQGTLLYANLSVRGRTTREIRDQQLAPAVAMRPDLATVFSGTNDVLSVRFDAASIASDTEAMQHALIECGATVLSFTLPDLSSVMPMARWVAHRVRALNEALRGASASSGAILLDFAAYPLGSDLRFWSEDRIHANASGHARIADALAHALGLPGADDSWQIPLPQLSPKSSREWFFGELNWALRYLAPWPWRSFRARFLDAPRVPRQPALLPVQPSA